MTDLADSNLLESLQADVAALTANNEYLAENLAQLELALDDDGWQQLSFDTQTEFSRDGLNRIVALSRLNSLKNPLIKRAVHLVSHYVWGQGVEVSAADEQVNDVIQGFLDDRGNRQVLFDSQARLNKDRTLTADGNVMLVLFPNPMTGQVKVRSIDVCQVADIVTNPDDGSEPWFYLRRWTERTWALDGPTAGIDRTVAREAWYPDWRYQPPRSARPESIGGVMVRWESPIYHVKVGGLEGMRFGVPETYAALDWAKAYKLFLEDWATIVRSLSRFAFQLTVKRKPADAAAKISSTLTPTTRESNPAPGAGSTFVGTPDATLAAVNKTGATVAAEDGVFLAKMVGAAFGLPYTILMGDPDMGNLATAKTLDRPTELAMLARQELWADVYRDLCDFQVDWAVRAPAGPLHGSVTMTAVGEQVVLPDEQDRSVEVAFPAILAEDVKERIDAVVAAWGTDLAKPSTILRLLLTALGVENVDELIPDPDLFDEEHAARQTSAGQAAVDAFRRGADPAAMLNGADPQAD